MKVEELLTICAEKLAPGNIHKQRLSVSVPSSVLQIGNHVHTGDSIEAVTLGDDLG